MTRLYLRYFFIVLAAVLLAASSWATIDFRYTVSDYGAGCKNAETEGGHSFEICYSTTVSSENPLESNAWYTSHPDSEFGGAIQDRGFMKRGSACVTSWHEQNIADTVSPVWGDIIIMASGWAVGDVAGVGRKVLTRDELASATNTEGHIVISSAIMTGGGRLEVINGPVTLADTEILAPGFWPLSVIATGGGSGSCSSFTHLEFFEPVPIANPATNNLGAEVIYGYHIYRADMDPSLSTPSDFSKVSSSPVRADGSAGPAIGCMGGLYPALEFESGTGAWASYYFNDINSTSNSHYVASPALYGGFTWPDGVEFLFESGAGNWYPVGAKSDTGLPSCDWDWWIQSGSHCSFDLNWRSLSPLNAPPAILRKKLTLPEPVWEAMEEVAKYAV